jgi:ATP-dependent protease ClpP protease subunit
MNGIIDYINSLSFKVNVVCRGQAISAGAWILAMGTGLRAMSKYSTLMLHEGSYSMDDKFHNMKTSLEHFKNLEMIGYKMLEEKTGIESKFWEDKCKQDWYLTAEEALTLKLIDKII